MREALRALEDMASAGLASSRYPVPEDIRDLIAGLRKLPQCSDVSDDEAETLARILEARLGVTMRVGAILKAKEYEPWLLATKANIDPYYWERYRKLLTQDGFPPSVTTTIDEVTDRILGLLENPMKEGPWDRRGMVVGHVQSGKTANYTGLICKAADAGYKLIVVIAGIHNNLRNQTQIRIDAGFVGRDSARILSKQSERRVGVGRFDNSRKPATFTNTVRDFNKVMASGAGVPLHSLSEPAVFVIKKNPHTLRNLLEWIEEHNAGPGGSSVSAPMLLIDDEADNASINIKHGQDSVSRINEQIRMLLGCFERSCYVGYTATPFANIFIDPESDDAMLGEDLFPRHFIVSLDPPSNYLGATRLLLDEPERFVRHIVDNEDVLPIKHRIDHPVTSIPESLRRAVRAFVIARAIRLVRGHNATHCSMLVNASRFTGVQGRIRNALHAEVTAVQDSVRLYAALPERDALRDRELEYLKRVWEDEYSVLDPPVSWTSIQAKLHEAAAPITVVEVNSTSSGALNYREHGQGLNVIAVGGYSLSRGLTLEGLLVSYFLRNSVMYDTLMQMGRWFGYREGYDDLCRVWMTEEAEGWYAHIAESIELLREELRTMESAGATPEDFGLKVRSHPDTLLVTARNKMGSSKQVVVSIGLANSFVETTYLWGDEESLAANLAAAQRLVASCGSPDADAQSVASGLLFRDVDVGTITRFVGEFRNHSGSMLSAGDPIRNYIGKREEELKLWDVLVASLQSPKAGEEPFRELGVPVNCQHRTVGRRTSAESIQVSSRQRVASRGVEKVGVDATHAEEVEAAYRDLLRAEGREPDDSRRINYPDHIYRAARRKPLLILHALMLDAPAEIGRLRLPAEPVIAWSISFPKTGTHEERVEFLVNTTWYQENFFEELEEEEIGGDVE